MDHKNKTTMLNNVLVDYYRCPDQFAQFSVAGKLRDAPGFFRFGSDTICYGHSTHAGAQLPTHAAYDALESVTVDASGPHLPFDPAQVIDNLRRERYLTPSRGRSQMFSARSFKERAYYLARPFMSVALRKHLQRFELKGWEHIPFPAWPVDRTVESVMDRLVALSLKAQGVERVPFIWFWPDGRSSCVIMTHDVEERTGLEFCKCLMDIDDEAGIRSSFQIVPEKRYDHPPALLKHIRDRGFEINIHDLNHDGYLFRERKEFLRRAEIINHYGRELEASGFRSGALYRNLDWYDALDFSYDMSVPNVAHLDPVRGGCCTIMPYFIGKILELPVTTTQDYTLFHILQDNAITLWIRQIEMIRMRHGLISFIIHPDYVRGEREQSIYRTLLAHLSKLCSEANLWITLPGEVDRWWRARSKMYLVSEGGRWVIKGEGSHRARVGFATLDGEKVKYSVAEEFHND
jgi:peptidoglycan/xylan/chitin deacetylase (PgdA/CDA1 family)